MKDISKLFPTPSPAEYREGLRQRSRPVIVKKLVELDAVVEIPAMTREEVLKESWKHFNQVSSVKLSWKEFLDTFKSLREKLTN